VGCALLIGGPEIASGQRTPADAAAERQALDHSTRLEQAGRPDEAMRALENYLDAQPASVSALLLLSQWAERYGSPARVLPRAEAAVQADRSGLPATRQIWIRSLYAAGFRDSSVSVARRWIEDEPDAPSAYTELSAIQARAGNLTEAIRILDLGRTNMGSNRVFVQEMAALQAERGSWADAAREWRAMLAWGNPGVEAVELRIVSSGEARSPAVAALQAQVEEQGATILERKGALHLALLLGEFQWAKGLARGLARDLPDPAALEVLRDYVRRATDAGDPAGASWGAAALADQARTEDDRRYWLAVSADRADDAGDPEAAMDMYARLLEGSSPGSDTYGLALRRLHQLVVREDPGRAESLLREHQDLYPVDTRTSTEMSVSTARAWMERGQLARAGEVIALVPPRDPEEAALQGGAMGRLEILAGRPQTARQHLEVATAFPTGQPEGRLEALGLLMLVDEVDSASVAVMAELVAEARRSGDRGPLVVVVSEWSESGLSGGERLADFLARELDMMGAPETAREVRILIVEGWPGSAVAPGALLELARADRTARPDRAGEWLERLIVEHPTSALAPVARRLLAELQAGVAGA
jgi:tetratricopeptide (TPR) repeat protein